MRRRIWLVTILIVACGSFRAADDSVDAGTTLDGGGVLDGVAPGVDGGSPGTDAGSGGDAAVGPAADAACDASRRCIDFESLTQRREDEHFGFDSLINEVDGGLVILDAGGFLSSAGLQARAVDSKGSRGELSFTTLPPLVRVRMKVRADARIDNGASSNHFLVFTCSQGENFSVKLSLNGNFAIQVGSDGQPMGTYVDGAWIAFDAVVANGNGMRSLTTTRLDTSQTMTITSKEVCVPPLDVRIGASNVSGNADFTLSVDDIAIDWN